MQFALLADLTRRWDSGQLFLMGCYGFDGWQTWRKFGCLGRNLLLIVAFAASPSIPGTCIRPIIYTCVHVDDACCSVWTRGLVGGLSFFIDILWEFCDAFCVFWREDGVQAKEPTGLPYSAAVVSSVCAGPRAARFSVEVFWWVQCLLRGFCAVSVFRAVS